MAGPAIQVLYCIAPDFCGQIFHELHLAAVYVEDLTLQNHKITLLLTQKFYTTEIWYIRGEKLYDTFSKSINNPIIQYCRY